MLTLEQTKSHKKSGWPVFGRTIAYEVATVTELLAPAEPNLALVLQQSSHTFNFPAVRTDSLLLVDESLGLPVSLATALQTATLYEGQSWDDGVSRQCAAVDFLQEFLELFLPQTIKLLTVQRRGLDISAANLIVVVERGRPMTVQLREVVGVQQQSANLPGFAATLNRDESYASFRTSLLNNLLRPLIGRLVELSGAASDVLWDTAISCLFQALKALPTDILTKERLRLALMLEELDMGERICGGLGSNFAPLAATESGFSPFSGDNLVYLKRKCCKKYKKNKRCDDCPGRKKK